MKKTRQIVISFMVFLAVTFFFLPSLGAAGSTASIDPGYAREASFPDLDQVPWAQKNIIRMKLRGVVSGYTDGSFQPNTGVKKVEAIIMAVKELNNEAQSVAAVQEYNLPENLDKDLPDWAKGYVSDALQKGLIRAGDEDFKWDEVANRAWIARLMIRLIGAEQQALLHTSRFTTFTDDSSIPEWARGYVTAAQEKGIIIGYSDGTFQPERLVTRAEMATILARSEQYMTLPNVISGTVEDINDNNIILSDQSDNLFRIYLADGAWIYIENEQVAFEKLQENDQVTLLLKETGVTDFIDILTSNANQTYTGRVVWVQTDQYRMLIQDENGDYTTYDIDNDVEIVIDGDSSSRLRDIDEDDEVEIQVADNIITRIEVITDSTTRFSSLEDSLNDDYEDDVESITLSGDEDDITVTVKIDESDWDDLSATKQKNLLQDICNDIWDAFDDADITGTVKDGSTTLETFTASAGDSISFDIDFDSLEDSLNDDYEDDVESITLSGDEDDITVTVKIDESDWDDLSATKQKNLLQDICDDIWNDFEDADITGTVKDGSITLETFTASAGDSISFDTDFDSLIDEIEDDYASDWTDNGLPFSLTISGDEDDITFKLSLSYTTYESDWDDLTNSDLESMMEDIRDAIAAEYDDADIIGYVYDTSGKNNLAKYSDRGLTRYHY